MLLKIKRLRLFCQSRLIMLCCLVACAGCRPNSNIQGKGEAYLQGEWQQQKQPVYQKLLTYPLYHLKFTCDSFYVQWHWFGRVNAGADTCTAKGQWYEYARGTYQQQHDTLRLKGYFCKADYTLKNDKGCFRSGNYDDTFKLVELGKDSLQLNSNSSVLPINLKLIKRTGCRPKIVKP